MNQAAQRQGLLVTPSPAASQTGYIQDRKRERKCTFPCRHNLTASSQSKTREGHALRGYLNQPYKLYGRHSPPLAKAKPSLSQWRQEKALPLTGRSSDLHTRSELLNPLHSAAFLCWASGQQSFPFQCYLADSTHLSPWQMVQ